MKQAASLGRFIVIEGIDGAGTTTQAQRLAAALREGDREVLLTREPTPGPIGALIRRALEQRLESADGAPRRLGWSSMALLFAADRLDHVEVEVLPAMARGAIVVSDRYVLSSLVYQAATSPDGEECARAWLRAMNDRAARPDLTVVLDVDAETAAHRRRARGGPVELFDEDALQARLALGYSRATELLEGERVLHVDGRGSEDEVFADVQKAARAVL